MLYQVLIWLFEKKSLWTWFMFHSIVIFILKIRFGAIQRDHLISHMWSIILESRDYDYYYYYYNSSVAVLWIVDVEKLRFETEQSLTKLKPIQKKTKSVAFSERLEVEDVKTANCTWAIVYLYFVFYFSFWHFLKSIKMKDFILADWWETFYEELRNY